MFFPLIKRACGSVNICMDGELVPILKELQYSFFKQVLVNLEQNNSIMHSTSATVPGEWRSTTELDQTTRRSLKRRFSKQMSKVRLQARPRKCVTINTWYQARALDTVDTGHWTASGWARSTSIPAGNDTIATAVLEAASELGRKRRTEKPVSSEAHGKKLKHAVLVAPPVHERGGNNERDGSPTHRLTATKTTNIIMAGQQKEVFEEAATETGLVDTTPVFFKISFSYILYCPHRCHVFFFSLTNKNFNLCF
jgi:hypothetical protein